MGPSPETIDALELELRQLGGVALVTFSARDGEIVIELAAEQPVDADILVLEAQRVAHGHFDGPVTVSVVTRPAEGDEGRPDLRVKVVLTAPVPGRGAVEVHLAHGDRRVRAVASTADRLAVAEAVVDALADLGFVVPFVPVSAHGVASELGAGSLVLLRNVATGQMRRGLASGSSSAESTTRAVLDALNRHLEPAPEG